MRVDPQAPVELQWSRSFKPILEELDRAARVRRIPNVKLVTRALLHLLKEGTTPKAIDVFRRVVSDAASLPPNNLIGYDQARWLTYVPEAVEDLRRLSTAQ